MQITKIDTSISLNLTKPFNRYTLSYSSTAPLRCTLTYTEGGDVGVEEFFLEAGENMVFASYTDGYLRHLTAEAALGLTVRTITHEACEFTIHGFDTEVAPVLAEKTF